MFWTPAHLENKSGVALRFEDELISYHQLARRVRQRQGELGESRRLVAIAAGNHPEPIITYLACLAGGHVAILNTADSDPEKEPSEIDNLYRPDSAMRKNASGVWQLAHLRKEPLGGLHPNLALLLSTSGSTGSPKLVRLSRRNIESNATAIVDYLKLTEADAAATVLPWSYCYGLSVLNTHFSVGGTVLLTDLSLADPCFWKLAESSRVTNISGVPYSFQVLEQNNFTPERLPSLRLLTQAGGKLQPGLVTKFAEMCADSNREFFVMYGQSEATARMAYLKPSLVADHPDCVGQAIPGGRLQLEEDDDLPPGQGELVYSGPNVMMGYALQRSDLSLAKTTWTLHTGDIAERTEQGLFRVVGRRSRIAKPFGLRIDLDRLGQSLQETCDEVVCVESSNGIGIITTSSATATEGIVKLAADITGLPQSSFTVSHVSRIPRLANGKIDFKKAGNLVTVNGPGVHDSALADSDVAGILAAVLRKPKVAPSDSFVSLGGDSLSYVAATAALQQRLGKLPVGWQRMSVDQLESLRLTPETPAGQTRKVPVRLETTAILRALAIVLVVGSHIGVIDIRGGAHLLLALAGFGLAKFLLTDADRRHRCRQILRSTWRVVSISLLWLIPVVLLSSEYGPSVLFVNNFFGPAEQAPEWRYWFLEALVYVLISVALLLWIPAVDRWERRWPFAFPLMLAGIGSAVALITAGAEGPTSMYTPVAVFWLFAAGWALERAVTKQQKAFVLLGVLVVGAAFFNRPDRVAVVVLGLTLAVTVTSLRVPRVVAPIITSIAAASLMIYLTHYQIYPLLGDYGWAALVVSLAAGVVIWKALEHAQRAWPRARKNLSFGHSQSQKETTNPAQVKKPLVVR